MVQFSSHVCPHCSHKSDLPDISEAIVCPKCKKQFELRDGKAVALPKVLCPHCLKTNDVTSELLRPYISKSCEHCGASFKPYEAQDFARVRRAAFFRKILRCFAPIRILYDKRQAAKARRQHEKEMQEMYRKRERDWGKRSDGIWGQRW